MVRVRESEPKSGDGRAQTIKRYRGEAVPLSGSMAPATQEQLAKGIEGTVEERQPESVDQRDHQHQLETVVPTPQTRAFQSQF